MIFKRILQWYIPMWISIGIMFLLVGFGMRFSNKIELQGVSLSSYPEDIKAVDFINGNFQKNFEDWFRDNFWGHNFLIKIHNQMEYTIFHDGIGDWIQGREGYLFSKSQSFIFVGGERSNSFREEEYDLYAKKLYLLQENLVKKGKAFLLVLNPSKAEIYPEKLPWYERLIEKQYSNDEYSSKNMLINALEKNKVNYYDTTEDLKKMKKEGDYDVFSKTGHHWTLTAAAYEVNKYIDGFETNFKIRYPYVDIINLVNELYLTDQDIVQLQNIFVPQYSQNYLKPQIEYSINSDKNLYLFGTSYGQEIMDSLYQTGNNKAFNALIYQQYFTDKTFYNSNGVEQKVYTEKNVPSDLEIMEEIRESDLILIEQPTVLQIPDTHLKFVDYLNANLDYIYYPLGLDIATATADTAAVDFEGFWPVEDWGRWMQEKEATITFWGDGLESTSHNLALYLKVVSYGQNQRAEIQLNGEEIGSVNVGTEYTEYSVVLPKEQLQAGENKISFILNKNLLMPLELNGEADNRKLGLGFQSIYIDRAD